MSGHIPCTCKGKTRYDNMVVVHRECNYSYFECPKGEWHYSEYSLVHCKKCGGLFRTKANYVDNLPDGKIK